MSFTYRYPHPAITTDCIIFGSDGLLFHLLLVERGKDPFKGCWAFPGGFMEIEETVEACAVRELAEETGVRNVRLEQLHTFSKVDRDPRERVVSVVFMSYLRISDAMLKAGDDAHDVRWFPLEDLPALAFDHADILRVAMSEHRQRLRAAGGSAKQLVSSWNQMGLEHKVLAEGVVK